MQVTVAAGEELLAVESEYLDVVWRFGSLDRGVRLEVENHPERY